MATFSGDDQENRRFRPRRCVWSLPELLEPRLLLSEVQWLPGLTGPESLPEHAAGQVVYLDFDGESRITFQGPVVVEGGIPPSFLPADAIEQVVRELSSILRQLGVSLVTSPPQDSLYSTVYISGGAAFAPLDASFWGIAEGVDSFNARPDDCAFVFSRAIMATTGNGKALLDGIATTAIHEVGHLLGLAHASSVTTPHDALADIAYTQGDWAFFTGGPVHQYLTQQAYAVFSARFGHTELSHYINGAVTDGSHDEDVAGDDPFDNADGHYWGHDAGYAHWWDGGYDGQDSAVNRAWKYFTGGRGLTNTYDTAWENNGDVRDQGLLWKYAHGDASGAYYWLGHVAHLLEDMTVPAHANADAHGFDDLSNPWDDYETYIGDGDNWTDWSSGDVSGHLRTPDEVYAEVGQQNGMYSLFLDTVRLADDFDSDDADGEFHHYSDGGAISDGLCDAIGTEMMPLAMKSVAELYRYFLHEVDPTPPSISMYALSSNQDSPTIKKGTFSLIGLAEDTISGVDKNGYHFITWKWNGNAWVDQQDWSAGDGTNTISASGDGVYRVQLSAVNGGGYTGYSPYYYFNATPGGGTELPMYPKGTRTFTDADGDAVTVTLTGGGLGSIYVAHDGWCDASTIVLNDTTEQSKLKITVKGAGGGTSVGGIDASGSPLGAISAPTTDLSGAVNIGPTSNAKASVALTFDQIANASIESAMPIKSLTAAEWLDNDGTGDVLTAPAVGKINIKGRKAKAKAGIAALRGDFQTDLELGGSGSTAKTLGSLSVAGVLDGSIITARGTDAKGLSIGTIKAGLVNDATVVADAGVSSVSASQWQTGSITAGWIGSISTKANKSLSGLGYFGADLALTGTGVPLNKATLGKVGIAGDLRGVVWDITGSMGAMKVSGMAGGPQVSDALTIKTTGSMGAITLGGSNRADFLAGIDTTAGGDSTLIRRADHAADFVNALASIKSITIKPPKGQIGLFLVDGNFSAAGIGAVKIVNAKFNNDQAGLNETQDDLGFWAKAVKSVKHTDTTDPRNKAKNWTWKLGMPLPSSLDDLNIQPLV